MMHLDEIDEKILKMLLADSRTPHTKIAEECAVSSPTITNRINKMKEKGLIIKEFLFFNLESLGYKLIALIGVNLKIGNEKKIYEIIRNKALLPGFNSTIGMYDVCATVVAKHFDELNQLKYILKRQQGVIEVEIHIFDKVHFLRDEVPIEKLGI